MDIAVTSAKESTGRDEDAVVGLVSAVACAAAGSLLGYSFLCKRRRLPVAGQILLGALVGVAGLVTWMKRQEEIDAAHRVIEHVHEVRDTRWLKKHPIAYG